MVKGYTNAIVSYYRNVTPRIIRDKCGYSTRLIGWDGTHTYCTDRALQYIVVETVFTPLFSRNCFFTSV
jgi:hypothetical protein